MTDWLEGRVCRRIDWHPELFTLTIEAAIEPFSAGQFIKLGLAHSDGKVVSRAYSLVNAPNSGLLQVLAVKVADGQLSPALHLLQPGDRLLVSARASGHLTLSEIPDGDALWLLATGTGISPFLSMLASAEPWRRFARIVLVYAVRHQRDLAHLADIEQWQRACPAQLTLIPVVSREPMVGALPGRIPELLANGRLEQVAGLPLTSRSQILLCGNPGMIHDASELLQARGLKRHRRAEPGNLHSERYW